MNDGKEIWEVPIRRSLVKRVFWMGVPRNILILELLLAVLGGVMLKTFTVLVVVTVIHLVLRYLGLQDPLFDQVFFRSLYHKTYYRG